MRNPLRAIFEITKASLDISNWPSDGDDIFLLSSIERSLSTLAELERAASEVSDTDLRTDIISFVTDGASKTPSLTSNAHTTSSITSSDSEAAAGAGTELTATSPGSVKPSQFRTALMIFCVCKSKVTPVTTYFQLLTTWSRTRIISPEVYKATLETKLETEALLGERSVIDLYIDLVFDPLKSTPSSLAELFDYYHPDRRNEIENRITDHIVHHATYIKADSVSEIITAYTNYLATRSLGAGEIDEWVNQLILNLLKKFTTRLEIVTQKFLIQSLHVQKLFVVLINKHFKGPKPPQLAAVDSTITILQKIAFNTGFHTADEASELFASLKYDYIKKELEDSRSNHFREVIMEHILCNIENEGYIEHLQDVLGGQQFLGKFLSDWLRVVYLFPTLQTREGLVYSIDMLLGAITRAAESIEASKIINLLLYGIQLFNYELPAKKLILNLHIYFSRCGNNQQRAQYTELLTTLSVAHPGLVLELLKTIPSYRETSTPTQAAAGAGAGAAGAGAGAAGAGAGAAGAGAGAAEHAPVSEKTAKLRTEYLGSYIATDEINNTALSADVLKKYLDLLESIIAHSPETEKGTILRQIQEMYNREYLADEGDVPRTMKNFSEHPDLLLRLILNRFISKEALRSIAAKGINHSITRSLVSHVESLDPYSRQLLLEEALNIQNTRLSDEDDSDIDSDEELPVKAHALFKTPPPKAPDSTSYLGCYFIGEEALLAPLLAEARAQIKEHGIELRVRKAT